MSRKDQRRKKKNLGKAPVPQTNRLFLIIFGVVTVAFLVLMVIIINNSDGVKMNKDPFNGVALPRVASFITPDCPQCIESIAVLEQLQSEYEGEVVFKTIDSVKDRAFLLKYSVNQAPSQVLIDMNGTALARSEGSHFTRADILASLASVFGIRIDFTELEGLDGYEVMGNMEETTTSEDVDITIE